MDGSHSVQLQKHFLSNMNSYRQNKAQLQTQLVSLKQSERNFMMTSTHGSRQEGSNSLRHTRSQNPSRVTISFDNEPQEISASWTEEDISLNSPCKGHTVMISAPSDVVDMRSRSTRRDKAIWYSGQNLNFQFEQSFSVERKLFRSETVLAMYAEPLHRLPKVKDQLRCDLENYKSKSLKSGPIILPKYLNLQKSFCVTPLSMKTKPVYKTNINEMPPISKTETDPSDYLNESERKNSSKWRNLYSTITDSSKKTQTLADIIHSAREKMKKGELQVHAPESEIHLTDSLSEFVIKDEDAKRTSVRLTKMLQKQNAKHKPEHRHSREALYRSSKLYNKHSTINNMAARTKCF